MADVQWRIRTAAFEIVNRIGELHLEGRGFFTFSLDILCPEEILP